MAGNLKIGATVDVGTINDAMTQSTEAVREGARQMAASFQECATKTRAAFRSISDDVKQSAQIVSMESIRVAEATKAYNVALSDQRKATVLTRDAKISDATSSAILAAAQQKVASTAATLAAAKEAEAAAVAKANESEVTSENFVVAGFQRAAASIGESLAKTRERLVLTGESAHISAREMTSAFSGLGELMGIGLLAGIAGHYIDEVNKMQIELGHLAVQTGISAHQLAGLHQIAKENTLDWEPIAMGLVRMNRALQEGQFNQAEYVRAFQELHINLQTFSVAQPVERLQMLATAFKGTDDYAAQADAAITIFGRGGLKMIPILKDYGDALTAAINKEAELTGVTNDSTAAAARWQAETERLTAQFQSLLIPIIDHVEQDIRLLVGDAYAVANVLSDVAITSAKPFEVALLSVEGLGRQMRDVVTGNWSKLAADGAQTVQQIQSNFKASLANMRAGWERGFAYWRSPAAPEGPRADQHEQPDSPSLKADEQILNQWKLRHKVTLDEEKKFWQDKLDVAEAGSERYNALMAKVASLNQRSERGPRAKKEKAEDDGFREMLRQDQEAQSSAERVSAAITETWVKSYREQQKADAEAHKAELASAREYWAGADKAAQDHYRVVQEQAEQEVQSGAISTDQRLRILRQGLDEEYKARLQAVNAQKALDALEPQRLQADLNRELQLTRDYTRQVVQLNMQMNNENSKLLKEAWDRASAEIRSAFAAWTAGGQSFAQSMAQVWRGMVENFTQNMTKMTQQFLTGILTQKAGQKSQIMGDAKTAAANTYSAVSAIPVVGPFLAPPAAAAAFGAVMAFDSFELGGVGRMQIPHAHVPALINPGERVLSMRQTQNFESLVNNSARSSSVAVRADIEQHFHGAQASSARETQRAIQSLARRGKLALA